MTLHSDGLLDHSCCFEILTAEAKLRAEYMELADCLDAGSSPKLFVKSNCPTSLEIEVELGIMPKGTVFAA